MTEPAPRVVLMGEPLVCLVADRTGPLVEAERMLVEVGGAELNAAVALVRLGLRAAVIARTGEDDLGEIIVRRARAEGVDVAHVRRDPRPTGLLIRDRRGFGASTVLYRRAGGAGSALDEDDVRAAQPAIAGAAWFHTTGITAALSATSAAAVSAGLAVARDAGVTTSLDVNYRSKLWSPAEAWARISGLLPFVDVAMVGEDEGLLLSGAGDVEALVAALRERGAREVLVKRGRAGALLVHADGRADCAALEVGGAVDEVGAGDAFAAGFVAGRLLGRQDAEALAFGACVAAFAVASVGDIRGLPTLAEVEHALRSGAGGTHR
jgi:2-dehydro-3-deoxygluconokinase